MTLLLCSAVSVSGKSEDLRPPFNKKPYLKTCWSQANPWWLPNRSCRYGKGGPDYAWHKYPDDQVLMWKKAAKVCKPYGMTGLQLEVTLAGNGKIYWDASVKKVADGFLEAGNGFKLALFLAVHKAPSLEVAFKQFDNLFDKLRVVLKDHPAIYRLDGAPVMTVYTPSVYSPENWQKIISHVEKKYGRIIILANAWNGGLRNSRKVLSQYLSVFDGISAYANWTDEGQRKFYTMASKLMHENFPQKIFEASVHNAYTVHFHFGGTIPKLMEKYFRSWDNVIQAKPDSIVMTNFFDIYENSRVLPSYELDDILLRTAQYYLEKWRGDKLSLRKSPDIYVSNYTNVLLGQNALFEIDVFPSAVNYTQADITLEICDAKGKVLHAFPPEVVKFDILSHKTFTVPSIKYANELAFFPRLKIKTAQGEQITDLFPPSMLVSGMRPHLLWWSRSLRNMLVINKGTKMWSLNTATNGDIIKYPDCGLAVIQSDAVSNYSGGRNQGGGTLRIMRNGREIVRESSWGLNLDRSLELPNPIAALDWYSLELVNQNDCRYLSAPIWVSGTRAGQTVKLPVFDTNDRIKEINISADRVPFFYYPCNFDTGSLLLDCSGYQHNGFLGGSGYGGGHLDRTAYRHEHLGGLKKQRQPNSPEFIQDGNKNGFYRFKGKQYITIQGGTAFPYASTYEIAIRPEKNGKETGIIGSGNNQLQLSLNPQGYVKVERSSELEGEGGSMNHKSISVSVLSREPVTFKKWNRIAVVYDLEKLSLYLNGKLQGEQSIPPMRGHEVLNVLIVGAKCRRYWQPYEYFSGDIKDIRIYGRNLSSDEFLK